MRLKIFSCHHVLPSYVLSTEIFQTLVSGIEVPDGSGAETDIAGINIADDNDFSELRHQYFIWKNRISEFDYIGFEHYRRPFLIDPLDARTAQSLMPPLLALRRHYHANPAWALVVDDSIMADYFGVRKHLTPAEVARVKTWIAGLDIVTTCGDRLPIDDQWRLCHDPALWPEIVRLVRASPYFADRECFIDFSLRNSHFRNMYIMRADLYAEYMSFCFGILFEMRDVLAIRSQRLYGYVSERLFSLFMHQKRVENPYLRVHELPVLVARSSL